MKRITRWILALVVTAALVVAIAFAIRPTPVPVEAQRVISARLIQSIDEEGETRIRERYVVSSPLTGRVRRITLDPGDPVLADQTTLAVLEPTSPELLDPRALAEAEARVLAGEAAVRRAEASVSRESAAYDLAEKELGRIAGARAQGGSSQQELDAAESAERTAAQARRGAVFTVEIARYELEMARSALLYARGEPDGQREGMSLRSPIDGAVLRVLQESSAVIDPGTPLLEIGDPRDLELVIDVLSVDAVKVHPGDRVIVDHWGGHSPLDATVRVVEPSAFTKVSALGIEEQRVNIIADLDTPPAERDTLGDQFHVEARIVIWEAEDVLQIPTSAVFRSGDGQAVYLIEDGRAVLRHIQVGRRGGRFTQIVDSLVEDELVILHPSDKLRPGVRIEISQRLED